MKIDIRLLFIFILFTSLSLKTTGQDRAKKDKMVGFGCYFNGQRTKVVKRFTDLLKSEKYNRISSFLKEGQAGEKFLATISLEKLAEIDKYQLSVDEKNLIAKIKKSGKRVSICWGCTLFKKVSLKTMFADDDFIGSNSWVERALEL